MTLVNRIRTMAAAAVCLTLCSSLATSAAAQDYSGGPREVVHPQDRAVSPRYAPRLMRPASTRDVVSPVAPVGYDYEMLPAPQVGAPIDQVIVGDGGCSSCGGFDDCPTCFAGCNEDCYNCGPAIDPRDCRIDEDCWIGRFGGLWCNSEFTFGAHGFKNQVFADPAANGNLDNCSFGLHGGFNTGLPLYRITCGLVSGQFGMNYVSSNLEDGFLSPGDRQQTFITTGLYRRVDYGLQFGVVADILHEEWITTLDVIQMRAELGWVFAGGNTLGFRFSENVQDENGFLGDLFPGTNAQAIDNYRLFWRHQCLNTGYAEFFYGRTDESHSLYGVDFDMPLSPRMALQTGVTYMQPDDVIPLSDNEAWNISVGVSFRPRGRDWYRFYHRPLFDVADNGTMILSRR